MQHDLGKFTPPSMFYLKIYINSILQQIIGGINKMYNLKRSTVTFAKMLKLII